MHELWDAILRRARCANIRVRRLRPLLREAWIDGFNYGAQRSHWLLTNGAGVETVKDQTGEQHIHVSPYAEGMGDDGTE